MDVADDLDARFKHALREAVEEQYHNGQPKLARALIAAGEMMSRSREELVRRLEAMGIYSFTPDQYRAMLEVIAAQMVLQAREQAEAKSTRRWEGRAARWGIPLGIAAFAVPIIVNQILGIVLRLH